MCFCLLNVKVTKSKTPTKSPAKVSIESTTPLKSPRKSVSKSIANENNEKVNKENGNVGINNVRSKLQRLGKLYSGKPH